MNQLYQELNPTNNAALVPQNNYLNGINSLLQSNPNLKQLVDVIKKGGNAKQMFFNLAKQKGVDPNTILSQLK